MAIMNYALMGLTIWILTEQRKTMGLVADALEQLHSVDENLTEIHTDIVSLKDKIDQLSAGQVSPEEITELQTLAASLKDKSASIATEADADVGGTTTAPTDGTPPA